MTSLPSNLPATITNKNVSSPYANPLTPGAYLINSSSGGSVGGSFPIFCSIANFSGVVCMNDVDNSYIVMPGYYLVTYYDSNYSYPKDYLDNTSGKDITYYTISKQDSASSCRLYYNSNGTQTEIKVSGIS